MNNNMENGPSLKKGSSDTTNALSGGFVTNTDTIIRNKNSFYTDIPHITELCDHLLGDSYLGGIADDLKNGSCDRVMSALLKETPQEMVEALLRLKTDLARIHANQTSLEENEEGKCLHRSVIFIDTILGSFDVQDLSGDYAETVKNAGAK